MRIRTIKPEFYRHEKLQELGPLIMLVFSGLWGASDKNGYFIWNEKVLKLDILPFIDYDIGSTLEALRKENLILKKIGDDGKFYGYIPTFLEHQRISGTESTNPAKFGHINMKNPEEVPGKHYGSTMEALGRSGKEEGIRNKDCRKLSEQDSDDVVSDKPGKIKRPIDQIWEAVKNHWNYCPGGSEMGKVVRDLKNLKATPFSIWAVWHGWEIVRPGLTRANPHTFASIHFGQVRDDLMKEENKVKLGQKLTSQQIEIPFTTEERKWK